MVRRPRAAMAMPEILPEYLLDWEGRRQSVPSLLRKCKFSGSGDKMTDSKAKRWLRRQNSTSQVNILTTHSPVHGRLSSREYRLARKLVCQFTNLRINKFTTRINCDS